MFRRNLITILTTLVFILGLTFTIQPALADWGVSFGAQYSSPYSSYYGDRITSDYRRGYQTDDWVERGSSSVTESPIYSDGIRLAAWATQDQDEYDYAIASAIYYFDVPSEARSFRIKVYYDGEGDRDDVNDEIAGRVWIKRTTDGGDYEEYYPSEGRYESVDKPLYGDTFVLPANKHLEIIRTSAQDHSEDGIMELHVVAEGRQRIDVKYIEVETYTYMPNVRVITRYYKDYSWGPWSDYTYWYFYTGPIFHFSDYYYVRYTYPYYNTRYIDVRRNYDNYLHIYYVKHPQRHIRWNDVAIIHKGEQRHWDRGRLNRWTPDYDEARRSYKIVSTKTNRSVEAQQSKERIRSVLANTPRKSPSALRASSVGIETRGSGVTEMKQRREVAAPRTVPDVRSKSTETRSNERTPIKTERTGSSDSTKVQSRSSIRTQTESNKEPAKVRKAPETNRSQEQQKSSQRNDEQIKKRREVSKESKSVEVRKTERVQPKEEKATPKKEEVKKSNDDDDDKDKDKDKDKSNSDDSSQGKKVRGK